MSYLLVALSACGGGTSSSLTDNSTTSHRGVVQKGPFEVGTAVIITQLDSSGKETSNKIQTKIHNNKGGFSFDIPTNWGFIEGRSFLSITAEGFYFDETSGKQSEQKLILSSITNSVGLNSVNLLSHWVAQRTKLLIRQGKSIKLAIEQSRNELSKVFGITHAYELDISQSENLPADNALLLLLSGALMEASQQSGVNPQIIIDEISSDFSDDGNLSELGDDWFIRMQAKVKNNPKERTNFYAKTLNKELGVKAPSGKELPEVIPLASRPSAILPKEIIVIPGKTLRLDGSESHSNPISNEGILINYTWFRVDQQSHNVPLSDRFSESPSITVPNEEVDLLFALVVTDEQKLTDTAVMKVSVRNPVLTNNPPVANDDTKSTKEDTSLNLGLADSVTTNDTDADGDALSITMVSAALNGSVQLLSDGSITFIPKLNFVGEGSFKYTISDGNGGTDTATVTINISAVNDIPVGIADSASTNEDTLVNITVITNDTDVDGNAITPTNISTPTNGTAVINNDGVSIDYTPKPNFNGTDSFTYTPNDGIVDGLAVTVTVTVGALNDAPVANADSAQTDEDQALTINPSVLLGNDTDIDGDTLTITTVTNPVNGQVVINSDGTITFTPNANFVGDGSFEYTISDDNGGIASAKVTINITNINDAPVANNQTINVTEDTALSFVLDYSDIDNDPASLSYLLTTPPLHGTLSGTAPNLIYTPDANYDATDSFVYKISDADDASDTAVVTINLTPVNDPPTARSFTLQVNQGESVNFVKGSGSTQLGGTDPEGDSLKVTDRSPPLNNPSTGIILTTDLGSGTFYSYVPNSGFCGTDTIQYKVQEINSGNLKSDFATVTFNVNCRPIADAGSDRSVVKNKSVTLSGLGSSDSDGTVEGYTWVQKAGTLPVVTLTSADTATPSFTAPDIAIGAASIDLFFELTVKDDDDLSSLVDEIKVTVTETCLTAPPVAITGVDRNVVQGSTVNLNGSGTADQSCNSENQVTDYSWTQKIIGSEPPVSLMEDNNYYPPKISFLAPTVTSLTVFTFELVVDDYPNDNDLSDPVTMTVTVHPDDTTLPANLPPTGNDYSIEILGNGYGKGIQLQATDPDGDDVDMTYQIITGIDTSIGDLDASYIMDGYVYYTPNYPVADFNSFSFIAIDQNGLASSPITVSITKIVEPITNNAPISSGYTAVISPLIYSNRRHDVYLESSPNPLAYDVDADDFIIFKKLNETTNGLTFSLNSYYSGDYLRAKNDNRHTPADGTYEYYVIDKYGRESLPATIDISFENAAPVATPQSKEVIDLSSAAYGSIIPLTTLEGTDPEGRPLTFEIVDSPVPDAQQITLYLDANTGVVQFSSLEGTGSFNFTFRVIDFFGLASSPATVTITNYVYGP